jgi:hypothetical protein
VSEEKLPSFAFRCYTNPIPQKHIKWLFEHLLKEVSQELVIGLFINRYEFGLLI